MFKYLPRAGPVPLGAKKRKEERVTPLLQPTTNIGPTNTQRCTTKGKEKKMNSVGKISGGMVTYPPPPARAS